jgi:hypothetical protein
LREIAPHCPVLEAASGQGGATNGMIHVHHSCEFRLLGRDQGPRLLRAKVERIRRRRFLRGRAGRYRRFRHSLWEAAAMKRGAPRHPKVAHLRKLLRLGLPDAVGRLELLWHFTAEFAPRGDIGRFSDERIEAAMDWRRGKPGRLIAALIESRLIDRHPECRLCVHDWPDHADQAVRKRLLRAGLKFVGSGKVADHHSREPDPGGPGDDIVTTSSRRGDDVVHTRSLRDDDEVKKTSAIFHGVSGKVTGPPEPEPYPEPEPRVSERKATSLVADRNIHARIPISEQGVASEDHAASAANLPQNATAPDLFQEFIGVLLAAGKLLNERDIERARKLWLNFDAPEHAAILEHLKRSVMDGTWSDARHTPMPASYLGSKAWTRIGPGRVLSRLPQARSKGESAQQWAEDRYLRGDK